MWQKAGFEFLAALEDDPTQRKLFEMLMPRIPLISYEQFYEMSPVDVFLGTLIPQGPSVTRRLGFDSRQEEITKLLLHVRPKALVLQLPSSFLRSKPVISYLYDILYDQYHLIYHVLKQSDYSGLPILGNQLYLLGIRKDVDIQFLFPPPIFRDKDLPALWEPPEKVHPWYRKLPPSAQIPPTMEKGYYCHCLPGREPRIMAQVSSGLPARCYVLDDLGPRRLTHTEYGCLKGYPEPFLGQLPQKLKMYDILQRAPDLYIAGAVADSLYRAFTEPAQPEVPTTHSQASPQQKTTSPPQPEGGQLIIEPRNVITNLYVEKLKGLKDLSISFGKGLTAIMGVNGAGKSTILHALACMFSPFRNGENRKFNFFFTPTPDASWQGSSFSLSYFDENTQAEVRRQYKKASDRWSPRYSSRPKRDVFYIGIDSGIPEIEKERQTSFIDYLTDVDGDKLSARVAAAASRILRKDYQQLTTHKSKRKAFFGVHTASDIIYTSLSMGAGEQRLIKILTAVYHATPYSLILIDELELLLHMDAQRQLVQTLAQLAERKHLQIIFTTHSLTIGQLTDLTEVRYLYHTCEKTMVFDHITSDIMYDLCRETTQPLSIYVEDDLAEAVVSSVTKALKLSRHTKITNIGSASNAFTLAAGWVLDGGCAMDNRLIVLDGDVYRTESDKIKQLEGVLSGTERDHQARINSALLVLTQLELPEGISPEKFIYDLIVSLNRADEVTDCAKQITSVADTHQWLNEIVARMHQDRKLVMYQIVESATESEKWPAYIAPVYSWLESRKNALGLSTP